MWARASHTRTCSRAAPRRGCASAATRERADGAAPETAYRTAFGFLAVTLIIALSFYLRVGDAKPSRDPRDGSDPVL